MGKIQRNNLITRNFKVETREEELPSAEGAEEKALYVEGYASVFDSETVLFELDGVEYKEMICTGAFDNCKMDDVIFNYNHEGKVIARTRNHTLELNVDTKGLRIKARLDGTEEGRRIYEEIKGGYIDRMSMAFTIGEESYDQEDHMWKVRGLKRLYDVSAVSIPAYDDTSIEARKNSILEAEAQEGRERKAAADFQRRKLMAKLKLSLKEEKND